MNTQNAFGFVSLGSVMALLPEVAPSLVASSHQTGVRELWLLFMGGVLVFVGMAFLMQVAWTQAMARVLAFLPRFAWRPAPQARNAPAGARLTA